jgi:hypothetical protein
MAEFLIQAAGGELESARENVGLLGTLPYVEVWLCRKRWWLVITAFWWKGLSANHLGMPGADCWTVIHLRLRYRRKLKTCQGVFGSDDGSLDVLCICFICLGVQEGS